MRSLLIALRALAVHKVRTILAMLGIFLGALALTGVLHISNSLTLKAEWDKVSAEHGDTNERRYVIGLGVGW